MSSVELLHTDHPDNTASLPRPGECHRFSEGRVFDPDQVANEINRYAMDMVVTANEIGKRLRWAKDELGHGAYGAWIDENIPFSTRTASRYMKLAQAFERHPRLLEPLARTSLKKALAITTLSEEELNTLEEGGTVAEMDAEELGDLTYSELQDALKKEKAARAKAEDEAHNASKIANREQENVKRLTRQLAERDGFIAPEAAEEVEKSLDNIKSSFDGWLAQLLPVLQGLNNQVEEMPPHLVAKKESLLTYARTMLEVHDARLNPNVPVAHADLEDMELQGSGAWQAPPSLSVIGRES